MRDRLSFVIQQRTEGLGRAVACARDHIIGDHFVLGLSDHLFLSTSDSSCAKQLVDEARALGGPVSSVEALPEHAIHRYGVVGGRPLAGRADCWQVQAVQENQRQPKQKSPSTPRVCGAVATSAFLVCTCCR